MNTKSSSRTPQAKMETVNAELLSFTYGAVVRQLVSDLHEAVEVNAQLEKMGYNIGIRIIDEFLAKSGARCGSFREAMETVSKVRRFTRACVSTWTHTNMCMVYVCMSEHTGVKTSKHLSSPQHERRQCANRC